jgi:hypothetical protein
MRKPRMSPAQVRLMDENFMAFANWLEKAGLAIGFKIEPWQRRIVDSMVRKGFLTVDGHITDAGNAAWKKATDKAVGVAKRNGAKLHPRIAAIKDQIRGRTASLMIVDDPETIA